MRKRLFNQQSEPGSREAQKTWRLSVKAKIMMALFALMLIPQGTWAQDVEYYLYDATTSKYLKQTASNYTVLDNSNTGSGSADSRLHLAGGMYVVNSDVNISYRVYLDGDVDIILCDGAVLNVQNGIDVPAGVKLTIYAQEKGTGQLNAGGQIYDSSLGVGTGNFYGAAIGGCYDSNPSTYTLISCGTIVIHGGQITANSNGVDEAAGIGGCHSDGSTVTIYGGKITATGGKFGAGIGGGGSSYEGGSVSIYGGEVIANGGLGDSYASPVEYEAMGIGRGSYKNGGTPGNNGTLSFLGTNIIYYGDNANSNPTTVIPDNTRYRYMKTDFTYSLSVAGTQVKASNASNILGSVSTATASFYAATNTLALNGLNTGNSIESVLDNLTIEIIGDNNITSGHIKSTNTTATLKIKKGADGSLKLNNTDGKSAVEGFASVDLEDVYLHASNCCKYVVNGTTRAYQYPETDTPYLSNVQDLEFTTTHYYPLWVGSQQVSETNKGNINFLGTGTASFEPSTSGTNTLILDGVLIDSSNGIESGLDNLTIALKGVNSINTNTAYHYYPIYSNVATAPLTIKKDETATNCSLTLSSSTNSPQVVKGFDSVTCGPGLDLEVTNGSGTITDASLKGVILRSLSFSGGDGTSGNPYLIATKEDLNDLAKIVNFGALDTSSKYFSVTTDIDCSGLANFEPIGSSTHAFKGTLGTIDNKNKTISNLQVNASDYAGLFGYVSGGTISNLTLHNCTIIGDNSYGVSYAGALAGTVDGASTISNNTVTGTTTVSVSTTNGTNKGYAGAIFGYYQSGTLSKNCYEYTVTVTGDDAVAKTGYTPRGDGSSGVDIATNDGAVLYTQTLSTATVANGTIVPWPIPSNTYTNNGKFPPGQTAYFKVTPSTGYAIDASSPKVTYTTATGASQTINGVFEANESSDGVNVYSFTMPDATDATATASLLVNISDAVYSAEIDPVTYSPTGSLAPTTVKLTSKGGTTITLSNTGNTTDFTITGIVDHSGNPVTEFTKADTYKVTIQGQGSYTGTKANISYTINPKSATGLTVNVGGTYTYTGSAIVPASANIEVKDGSTTLALNTDYTITSCTNNTNAATSSDANAPTVTITGMGNYDNSTAKGTFTIGKKDITNAATFSAITDQTYTGTEIKPTPTVSIVLVDGAPATDLDSSADFDYGYTNNKGAALSTDASAPTVTVTGKGNFTGTASTKFTIKPKSANGLTVTVGGTYTYKGSAIEPAPTDISVSDGTTSLNYNTDYTISYNNNTNAGTTAEVIITGKGNYDSATNKTEYFTIGQADLAGVTIDAIANQTFTGLALTPPVSVTFNGTPVASSEYNVNYTNNTNVGTATVTLTSTNINFSTVNSKVANFTIAAASATITATSQTVTYNGTAQAITGVSVDKGSAVITYYNSAADRTTNTGGTTTAPTNAATYYVRVTQGDASYTSVPVDVTFTISPKSANGLTVTVGGPYTYTGSAIEPALSVTDGRTPLTAGTDYTVSYTSNVNVGTATATVTGIGNYTGSIPQTFSIIPKSIKGVSVTIGGIYTYTGAAIVPADADITVTDGTMTLDKDKDYTLSVTNNTNAGTATVTVTGKGNYDSATSEIGSFTIDQATITSVTLDQTLFVYAPRVAHSVNVTVMAGSLTVPSGSYTVTVDGVTGNSATAVGTHTVRATARTDIANNFKGYAETTFTITERTVSIDFGGRTFRTFYDGNETFLLPDGITAYIVTGVNGDAVTVKQVSYVLQGIPVLLESTPGTTNVADPAESFTGNLLQYAAAATPATDKHYVLYNNEFVRASGTINGKVYLDLTGYSGAARALVIGDGTTGINVIVSDEDDGDAKWYDMQGRRISKPTKSGVYIKDGKKVVVKTRY